MHHHATSNTRAELPQAAPGPDGARAVASAKRAAIRTVSKGNRLPKGQQTISGPGSCGLTPFNRPLGFCNCYSGQWHRTGAIIPQSSCMS